MNKFKVGDMVKLTETGKSCGVITNQLNISKGYKVLETQNSKQSSSLWGKDDPYPHFYCR